MSITMKKAFTPVRIDVTGFAGSESDPDLTGPLSQAAWVFTPPTLPEALPLVICLPGGSYTKAYWHLEVPGYRHEEYSFALALARQGCVVVCLDHLGVGESTLPPDGRPLTLSLLASANAEAVRSIQERLRQGTLIEGLPALREAALVGVGHSWGAFLLLTQQAAHRSFAAISLLGFTAGEMAMEGFAQRLAARLEVEGGTVSEVLARMYNASPNDDGYITLDRSISHSLFHADDVPQAVIEADDALVSATPTGSMLEMSQPGAMLEAASRVNVPLFLANGQLVDISADFRGEPRSYTRATDITLYEVAGAGHCHNFAGERHAFWNRLARWILALEPVGDLG